VLERLIGVSSEEVLQFKNNPQNCALLKEKIEKVYAKFTVYFIICCNEEMCVFRELKEHIENCICSKVASH